MQRNPFNISWYATNAAIKDLRCKDEDKDNNFGPRRFSRIRTSLYVTPYQWAQLTEKLASITDNQLTQKVASLMLNR